MMKNRYSDDQLIRLLGSAEDRRVSEAVAQLYRQHKDMITRLVRQNSGTSEDAEEVLDDALVGLWKAVRAGRYQPTAQLKTYLYQIARHTWLNRIRAASKEIELIDTEPAFLLHQSADMGEWYDIKEMFDAYWHKIRAAGGRCYDILWAFAEGYTMQEIAVRFALGSADIAKTMKYNCLKKVGKPY